jgi:hypothetical protein
MIWTAPMGKDTESGMLERHLWNVADQFRTLREKVSPMLELLNVVLQKEEVSRRTRDLILPSLMLAQVNFGGN